MVMQSEALRALTKRLLASIFDESYGCETKELYLLMWQCYVRRKGTDFPRMTQGSESMLARWRPEILN